MGRARLLTSLIGTTGLPARVSALESRADDLEANLLAMDAELTAALQDTNEGLAQLTSRYNAQKIKFHRLGSGQENPNGPSVQITTGAGTLWKAHWKMQVPFALYAGDRIAVLCELQVRNDATYFVEVAQQMVLTLHPNLPENVITDVTGVEIAGNNGHNVAPVPDGAHYSNVPKCTGYQLVDDYLQPYIYVRVRCRSSEATGGEFCTLLSGGYGHLSLFVFPKDPAA